MQAGNAIFTVLASQLVGYGYAGLFRGMLVYPTVRDCSVAPWTPANLLVPRSCCTRKT
jgi:hypothetical protein